MLRASAFKLERLGFTAQAEGFRFSLQGLELRFRVLGLGLGFRLGFRVGV